MLLIVGDLNGHVGANRDGYERHHGGWSMGTRNLAGEDILTFAEANDLSLCNTFFKKRESHLATYYSGGRFTQIDFWLVRSANRKLVKDAKVIPSECVAPQHRLLVIDVWLNTKPPRMQQRTGPERVKWWRERQCRQTLQQAFNGINADPTKCIEDMWRDVSSQIRNEAGRVLGKTKPGRARINKETWWWNDEVQMAVRHKKTAFQQWKRTCLDQDRELYKTAKSDARRAVARAKSDHYNRLYDELSTARGENQIYRLAKARHRATADIQKVVNIRAADHSLLTNHVDILDRWQQYFAGISNVEFPHPPIPTETPIHGPVEPISAVEVESALKKMKNGKAPGPDDIPSEAWNLLGAKSLAAMINKALTEGSLPTEWATSITIPIWKGKGDVCECNNYRPIRLLCHAMKIFERVLDARLRSIITPLTSNQCGFVKGTSTSDAIFATRMLIERHREKRKPLHIAFLDLEKAFDRVPHDLIWMSLRKHGVPEPYIAWIKLMYTNVTSVVQCPAGKSDPFDVTVGVHQGSALSPLLFIVVMNAVTADIQLPHPWSLLFADDVMLAATTRAELERLVQTWSTRLAQYGLRLNLKKTEYMECGPQSDGTITIDGSDLPKSTKFKYLGATLSADGDSAVDARARTSAAWLKWRQVTGVLCDRRIPKKLKSKIYKTVVRPVALYGCECWPVTSRHEQIMHTAEMKQLRWALGKTRLDRVRNTTIRQTLDVEPIQLKMCESRLRWYGHVMRRDHDSVSRRALEIQVAGKRPRGRPKQRYTDTIQRDLAAAGATADAAQDRRRWIDVTRRAARRYQPEG